jgi:hypothetical protein
MRLIEVKQESQKESKRGRRNGGEGEGREVGGERLIYWEIYSVAHQVINVIYCDAKLYFKTSQDS